MARRAWETAGVADRIELRIAPGADTLRALPETETIDLAFIDADKPGYPVYYEEMLEAAAPERRDARRQRALGRSGRASPTPTTTTRMAIRAFNDMVAADDRVDAVMLPIADGLTLCRKK